MKERDSSTIIKRNTRQKALIYETVQEHHDHPSADAIYNSVRKKDGRVSKGTVYRNLNELSQSGRVNQLKTPGSDRFDLRLDNHYHILCIRCNSVIDVDIDYDSSLDEKAEDLSGYIINKHRLLFEGICPKCQKKIKDLK